VAGGARPDARAQAAERSDEVEGLAPLASAPEVDLSLGLSLTTKPDAKTEADFMGVEVTWMGTMGCHRAEVA
jgi:hypothetical protein